MWENHRSYYLSAMKVSINNTSRREYGKNDQGHNSTPSMNFTSVSLLENIDDNILWTEDDQTSEVINTINRMDPNISL